MNRIIELLATFPTTPYRILVSTIGYLATVAAVFYYGREPSEWFYGFLLAWAGIDVAQFHSKRKTFQPPEPGA